MANVIHIRRQPTGLEQAGQSMQELANNFIQHTLAMAQQQNAQNMQMMGLGMQERRMADANARDDRRWKESTAMQERRFAQEDKWKQAQLDLQKQQLGRSYAAMDKPQLTQVEGPYGNKISVWVNPRTQQITPASIPGMEGDTGGGIPGLDADFNAATSEVLDPNWSPVPSISPGVRKGLEMIYPNLAESENGEAVQPTGAQQVPSLASAHTADPLARAFDLLGVKFPQSGQPQAEPAAPMMDEPAPSAPVIEMPQMPEPASLDVNGVKITVDNFPPQLLGSPRGQAILSWLKSRDEANIKRYNMDMGAFEAAQKTGKSTHMPIDTAAKKDAFDLRSQWDEAMRVEKQLDAFAASGGEGGTGLLLGMLPQTIQNRIDPGGTNLRSAISQMSSVIMNALSGAAVSDQERVRLEGFLPTASDDLPTIRKKLEGYKDYIATKSASWRSMYGEIAPLDDIKAHTQKASGANSRSPQLPPGFRMVN